MTLENTISSGKEEFINLVRLNPSLLKEPISKDILGKDYDKVLQDIEDNDKPELRLEYGKKLSLLGYSPELINNMSLGEAKQIIEKTKTVKALISMGFNPDEINSWDDEYRQKVISLVRN